MKRREGVLHITIGRLCLFLFLMILVLVGLFLLGSFQEFLDSTQVMILGILRGASLLFISFSLYYIITLIAYIVRGRRFYVVRFIFSILGAGLVGVIYFLSNFLNSWLH